MPMDTLLRKNNCHIAIFRNLCTSFVLHQKMAATQYCIILHDPIPNVYICCTGARIGATIFSVVCRAAMSSCVVGMNVWIAEMYPTSIRFRIYGYAVGIGSLFTLAGPFIGSGLVR